MNGDYLAHHGILGMKWGVRRYQNADGSLTLAGKKRISKQYSEESIKTMNDLRRQYNKMYINSYNKAADDMNKGGIDKFNKQQQKKYGKNYTNRNGYQEDYMRTFNKKFNKIMNQSLNDFYTTNEHSQKAQELVKRYGMEKWDTLAKENSEKIAELRRAVENK